MTDLQVAKKLCSIYNSAESRGIEFNMSFKRMKILMNQKKCCYTGVVFTEEEGPNHRSIDRIDNSKGYTDENTVACTVAINLKKRDLTIAEIKGLYNCIKHL